MRCQRRACKRGKSPRRGIVPARVHRSAPAGARRARKAPAYRRIWMPAACYRGLKCLRRAEFHACGIRRQAQRDVARDRQRAGGGFCRIRMARGRNLHRLGRWHVNGRGVHAGGRDRSLRHISTRHAVYAPTDGGVSCARYCRYKRRLAAKHNRSIRWCYGHYNGWKRRRWRRQRRACCTAAERPRPLAKKCDDHNRRCPGSFSVAPREGPHALPKAGEGPAKKGKPKMRITQTALENSH